MDEGVDGGSSAELTLGCPRLRSGDTDLRIRAPLLVDDPRLGELLLSLCPRPESSTEVRTGEDGGNASSRDLRGALDLLGDPKGLSGRCS